MILVAASGIQAACPFSLIDGNGNPVAGKTWNNVGGGLTDELKVYLPSTGSYANADRTRIFDLGSGDYEYRLTALETATAGKVYYKTNVSGYDNRARWEDVVNVSVNTAAIATAVWDEVIENAKTARQILRGIKASTFGKLVQTLTSRAFRDDADTKNRILATVDSTGRPIVTVDLT